MPAAIDADNRGKHGNDDDHGNDVMNPSADIGNQATEKITTQDHRSDPEDAAKNVEEQIAGIGHFRGAGDGRAERSNDRNEARQDDGPAAIFFVEVMGALKMASPEEERVFAPVQGRARRAANPIPNLVAHDGTKHDGQEEPFERNHAGSRENSRGHQKGITGKKKTYKKAGFNEDDRTD